MGQKNKLRAVFSILIIGGAIAYIFFHKTQPLQNEQTDLAAFKQHYFSQIDANSKITSLFTDYKQAMQDYTEGWCCTSTGLWYQ